MQERKKHYKRKIFIIAFFIFVFFPSLTKASEFFFDSAGEQIYQGDTFIVKLKLSTADNLINAAEGYLSFDNKKLEVKEISTGGSIFSLWPKPAAVLGEKGEISFVGGVAGGFKSSDAEILKIIFLAKNKGIANINVGKNSALFLNDGKGTKASYTVNPLKLSILERPVGQTPKDEWRPMLEQDKIPPEPFELIVDKSKFVFEGDYFVSFFTTDKESGIDYYEIKEGDNPFVRASSPYKLSDQNLRGKIEVKAVDKAGNVKVSVLQPLHPEKIYQKLSFWGIIILTLLFVGILFGRKIEAKLVNFIRSRK
jgi:hypothetical protein